MKCQEHCWIFSQDRMLRKKVGNLKLIWDRPIILWVLGYVVNEKFNVKNKVKKKTMICEFSKNRAKSLKAEMIDKAKLFWENYHS